MSLENKKGKHLAIIPARGGSKRLPGKNIMLLKGKPLIHYTIEAALNSHIFDEICVSSDCEQILETASFFNSISLLKRPDSLATDEASSEDVILHALKTVEEKKGCKFDSICLLQPTSPLRNENHIIEAYTLFFNNKKECIVKSAYKINRDNFHKSKFIIQKRSNSYETYEKRAYKEGLYSINGAIYIYSPILFKKKSFLEKSTKPIIHLMNEYVSVDIDTQEDFDLAQDFFQRII